MGQCPATWDNVPPGPGLLPLFLTISSVSPASLSAPRVCGSFPSSVSSKPHLLREALSEAPAQLHLFLMCCHLPQFILMNPLV